MMINQKDGAENYGTLLQERQKTGINAVKFSLILMLAVVAFLFTTMMFGASETDTRIEAAFKNSYIYKTYLKGDQITICSKDGVVTLSGEVAFKNHKPMAQDIAEALPGVKRVTNQIKIVKTYPAEQSDAWIALNVKWALMFHRNVNAYMTDVSVKDGKVTLKGEASSQAQKGLTAEYAKDIFGVKGVDNQMTVAKVEPKPAVVTTLGEQVDDSSITVQVKWALLTHRSTSFLRTTVSTVNGVVTLSGQASNGAEKDLVGKLVEDINGVQKVVNNMTIEPAKTN